MIIRLLKFFRFSKYFNRINLWIYFQEWSFRKISRELFLRFVKEFISEKCLGLLNSIILSFVKQHYLQQQLKKIKKFM